MIIKYTSGLEFMIFSIYIQLAFKFSLDFPLNNKLFISMKVCDLRYLLLKISLKLIIGLGYIH